MTAFVSRLMKFWLVFFVLVLGVYVAVHNYEKVTVQLPPFIAAVQVPAYVALLGAFMCGALTATAFLAFSLAKTSLAGRKMRKRLKNLEDEREALQLSYHPANSIHSEPIKPLAAPKAKSEPAIDPITGSRRF